MLEADSTNTQSSDAKPDADDDLALARQSPACSGLENNERKKKKRKDQGNTDMLVKRKKDKDERKNPK